MNTTLELFGQHMSKFTSAGHADQLFQDTREWVNLSQAELVDVLVNGEAVAVLLRCYRDKKHPVGWNLHLVLRAGDVKAYVFFSEIWHPSGTNMLQFDYRKIAEIMFKEGAFYVRLGDHPFWWRISKTLVIKKSITYIHALESVFALERVPVATLWYNRQPDGTFESVSYEETLKYL